MYYYFCWLYLLQFKIDFKSNLLIKTYIRLELEAKNNESLHINLFYFRFNSKRNRKKSEALILNNTMFKSP